MAKTSFESRYPIGEYVLFDPNPDNTGYLAKITRVTFSKSKVTYDLKLELGGETLRNVDSCFIHDYN